MKIRHETDIIQILNMTLAKIIMIARALPSCQQNELLIVNLTKMLSKFSLLAIFLKVEAVKEQFADVATLLQASLHEGTSSQKESFVEFFHLEPVTNTTTAFEFSRKIFQCLNTFAANLGTTKVKWFRKHHQPTDFQLCLEEITDSFANKIKHLRENTLSQLPAIDQLEINFTFKQYRQVYDQLSSGRIPTSSNPIITTVENDLIIIMLRVSDCYLERDACFKAVTAQNINNAEAKMMQYFDEAVSQSWLIYFREEFLYIMTSYAQIKAECLFKVIKNELPKNLNENSGNLVRTQKLICELYGFDLPLSTLPGNQLDTQLVVEVLWRQFMEDGKVRDALSAKILTELNNIIKTIDTSKHGTLVECSKFSRFKEEFEQEVGLAIRPDTNEIYSSPGPKR